MRAPTAAATVIITRARNKNNNKKHMIGTILRRGGRGHRRPAGGPDHNIRDARAPTPPPRRLFIWIFPGRGHRSTAVLGVVVVVGARRPSAPGRLGPWPLDGPSRTSTRPPGRIRPPHRPRTFVSCFAAGPQRVFRPPHSILIDTANTQRPFP